MHSGLRSYILLPILKKFFLPFCWIEGILIGALDGNLPPRDYLRQRAVYIYHPLGRACLYHSRDLVCAFLADKVRDRLVLMSNSLRPGMSPPEMRRMSPAGKIPASDEARRNRI